MKCTTKRRSFPKLPKIPETRLDDLEVEQGRQRERSKASFTIFTVLQETNGARETRGTPRTEKKEPTLAQINKRRGREDASNLGVKVVLSVILHESSSSSSSSSSISSSTTGGGSTLDSSFGELEPVFVRRKKEEGGQRKSGRAREDKGSRLLNVRRTERPRLAETLSEHLVSSDVGVGH